MKFISLTVLSLLSCSIQSYSQVSTVTATERLVVDDNGSFRAEMTGNPWGGSHGIFFGSKINYTGSDNLWGNGNAVYSHAAGPYNFGAFSLGYIANGGTFGFYDGGLSTGANQPISWNMVMSMTRGGNVGIATAAPAARFHVNGDALVTTFLRVGEMPATTNGQYKILGREGIGSVDANNKTAYLWSKDGVCAVSAYDYATNSGLPLQVNLESTNTYINGYGGQVVIGNREAIPAAYKLGVAGGIIAEKIKVKVQPWPDYVFEKNYRLLPLTEVETFIKSNKHLPGIAPASIIEKEGLDLGSGQADLLKKIEELTLYLIDQDKKLTASTKTEEDLAKKIDTQQKKIDQQQAELDVLKEQMKLLLKTSKP